MICYAIKNEEGLYFQADEELCSWGYIFNATLFGVYKIAQCCCPSDCKVVKVEIREVEDE